MGLPGVTYVPSPLHGFGIILLEKIWIGDFQLKRVNVSAPAPTIH
jgi:hypothetical protein